MAPWLASPTSLAYFANTPLLTALLGGFQDLSLSAISSSDTFILKVLDSADMVTISPFLTTAMGPPTAASGTTLNCVSNMLHSGRVCFECR